MYYFLNINIGKSLTGIEHSALARLRLFKEIDLNQIIITTTYTPIIFKHFQFGRKS